MAREIVPGKWRVTKPGSYVRGTSHDRFTRWCIAMGLFHLCFPSILLSTECVPVGVPATCENSTASVLMASSSVVCPSFSSILLYVCLPIVFLSWLVSFFHHLHLCRQQAGCFPIGAQIILYLFLSCTSTTNCSDLIIVFFVLLFWNLWLQPWFFIFLSPADSTVPGI